MNAAKWLLLELDAPQALSILLELSRAGDNQAALRLTEVEGDEVVVAARLQEIASRGPAYIVIGEKTYEEVKDIVEVRSLGSVEVRHREQPVEIYELLDLR